MLDTVLDIPGQQRAETLQGCLPERMPARSMAATWASLTTTAPRKLWLLISATGPDQYVVVSAATDHMPVCICKNKPWRKLWSGLQKAFKKKHLLSQSKRKREGCSGPVLKCTQRGWDAQKGSEILFFFFLLESNLEMVWGYQQTQMFSIRQGSQSHMGFLWSSHIFKRLGLHSCQH